MMHNESEVVSRVKISGNNQPKNLASLKEQGYDIYFIESITANKSNGGFEPFFYYEALRNEEKIRAVTPQKLLQLSHDNTVHSPS